ncbi:MAG: TIGR00730 family Rossman fold protein [Pseudomonadota bacterium]
MKRICVFCGSSTGFDPRHAQAARALGGTLAQRRLGLVYGGGHVGLMGILADAVLAADGEAVGVIPEVLMEREVGHHGLTELHVVGSMHERKARMAELSDGFIALPGGIGTLEEFFEVWTWAQLGLHRKPVGLLNVAGYFDYLIAFLDHTVAQGFLQDRHRALVLEDRDPAAMLDRFERYQAPAVAKWLDRQST